MPDNMKSIHLYLLVLLVPLSLMTACKTPTERFLTRKDGVWKIDTLVYQRSQDGILQVDTTFANAGEMAFVVEYDLKKDEDNRNFEGYIQEPREVWINGAWQFSPGIYHVEGSVRDHFLQIDNDFSLVTFYLEKIEVLEREKNRMVWYRSQDSEGTETNWTYTLTRP